MNKSTSTMRKKLQKIQAIIMIFLILGFIDLSFAEDKLDSVAIMRETQKISKTDQEVMMTSWLPLEFWQASFENNLNMTTTQKEEITKILRPYIVVIAINGKIGVLGGITYDSEAVIKNGIQIIDNEGTFYSPLADDKINPDAKNFLLMIKPSLANTLGEMGKNMCVLVFPSLNERGENIADAKREGSFSIKLDTKEFKWRLPLASVIPPKTCPVDGEKMNGAWKFCPWHGVKIE